MRDLSFRPVSIRREQNKKKKKKKKKKKTYSSSCHDILKSLQKLGDVAIDAIYFSIGSGSVIRLCCLPPSFCFSASLLLCNDLKLNCESMICNIKGTNRLATRNDAEERNECDGRFGCSCRIHQAIRQSVSQKKKAVCYVITQIWKSPILTDTQHNGCTYLSCWIRCIRFTYGQLA